MDEQTTPETNSIDMETAISSSDLGLTDGPVADGEVPHVQSADPIVQPVVEEPEKPVLEEIPAPASIAKAKADLWKQMPREAQELYIQREQQMLEGMKGYKTDAEFGRSLKDVLTPYKAFLASQGVDEPKAAQYLLNAHFKLTHAQPHEKAQYLSQLAQSYGIDLGQVQAQNQVQVDPVVRQLNERLAQLEGSLTQRQQQQLDETKTRVSAEVGQFAESNPYFEEVADDMVPFIQAGADLKTAYDKAIWANPVTRAKEQARLQSENEKALKAKAQEEAANAKRATSANVRTRDTNRAPTEPLGTMEDTMREVLKNRASRTH